MAEITSRRLKIEYDLLSKEHDLVESVTLTDEDDFGKWKVTINELEKKNLVPML